MLNYAAVKVSDLERSAAFYDSMLAPLGWRRQEAPADTVGWGLIKAVFFIELSDTQRPGYGLISFPAKSIPAVKASFESGSQRGGEPVAEPGSAASFGSGQLRLPPQRPRRLPGRGLRYTRPLAVEVVPLHRDRVVGRRVVGEVHPVSGSRSPRGESHSHRPTRRGGGGDEQIHGAQERNAEEHRDR